MTGMSLSGISLLPDVSTFFCKVLKLCACLISVLTTFIFIGKPAVKLHKHFVHFKNSLRVNKKNVWGEFLRSLSQVPGTIYTSNE